MKIKFLKKKREGSDFWSFYFEPSNEFKWEAGQSVRLELPKPTWGTQERRFTIASAPHEKLVQITTLVSDSQFKQTLAGLKAGEQVDAYGVEGDFLWGNGAMHRLFIAGGIGVTPFRSLIVDRLHQPNRPLNASLIYSSRLETPVFMDEITAWAAQDPSLDVAFLQKRLVVDSKSTLPDYWRGSLAYISGPTGMVDELATRLLKHGLPEANIRLDRFTGLPG